MIECAISPTISPSATIVKSNLWRSFSDCRKGGIQSSAFAGNHCTLLSPVVRSLHAAGVHVAQFQARSLRVCQYCFAGSVSGERLWVAASSQATSSALTLDATWSTVAAPLSTTSTQG